MVLNWGVPMHHYAKHTCVFPTTIISSAPGSMVQVPVTFVIHKVGYNNPMMKLFEVTIFMY